MPAAKMFPLSCAYRGKGDIIKIIIMYIVSFYFSVCSFVIGTTGDNFMGFVINEI